MSTTLEDRITWALEEHNISVQQLADAFGVSRAAASYWADGSTKNLKMQYLFTAAKALKVSAEWLALGQGSPYASTHSDYVEIPMVAHRLSKKSNNDNTTPNFLRSLSFRRDWLEFTGLEADFLEVDLVEGKAMTGLLNEADVVLIDKRDNSLESIENGAVYALCVDGTPIIKRVFVQELGGVVLESENSSFKDIEIPKNDISTLEIIGRIVWHGGEVR